MQVALVNTNQIKPPIAPIGLEYLAEALYASGHPVEIFDPSAGEAWEPALAQFFGKKNFGLVGVTLRNTDDCVFTSRQSFLAPFSGIVKAIRQHTDALIVVGGVGFSVMPEQILSLCGADAGIWGEGEFSFVELANRIEEKRGWFDLPNLICRHHDRWQRNPSYEPPLEKLPPMNRRWIDNQRYFREGGQAGIETKRGCSQFLYLLRRPRRQGEANQNSPISKCGR